jgi:hypothetical protein
MSGSMTGGVNSDLPLAAGKIGQSGGNSLASSPNALVDMMTGLERFQYLRNQNQLFPGQQQLQQQEIQQRGITNEQLQQQLTAYKNKQVAAGMMPLFLKGDSATLSDATSALGWLQAFGSDTNGMTAALKASGATGGKPLLDVVRAGIIQAYPDLGVPKIEYQQQGDTSIPVNTNIYAGPLGQMGPAIPTTLTPAQKADRVTAVGAGGQEGSVTRGSTVDRYGNATPQPAIGGGSPLPTLGPAGGGGAPMQSPMPGASAQPGNPSSFLATRPLPSFTNDQTAYQTDQRGVAQKQNSVVNLDTAMQALKLTQSGVSTEAVHNFYSFLKAQGMTPPFGDANVTQYDIARKAMISFAANAAGAGGTDLSRMMSTDSNANMHIDTDAAMHVLKQNAGLVNRDIGMVHEAPNPTGSGYLNHTMNFPLATVPEAFAWDRLSEPERQAVRNRMASIKGGTDMLHRSLEIAATHKLIGLPNQPPASGQ